MRPAEARNLEYSERVREAADCYLCRRHFVDYPTRPSMVEWMHSWSQYRPQGTHMAGPTDPVGRIWKPAPEEWSECCAFVKRPTLKDPISLWKHCISQKHLANLYGVSLSDLKKQIKTQRVLEALAS